MKAACPLVSPTCPELSCVVLKTDSATCTQLVLLLFCEKVLKKNTCFVGQSCPTHRSLYIYVQLGACQKPVTVGKSSSVFFFTINCLSVDRQSTIAQTLHLHRPLLQFAPFAACELNWYAMLFQCHDPSNLPIPLLKHNPASLCEK